MWARKIASVVAQAMIWTALVVGPFWLQGCTALGGAAMIAGMGGDECKHNQACRVQRNTREALDTICAEYHSVERVMMAPQRLPDGSITAVVRVDGAKCQ